MRTYSSQWGLTWYTDPGARIPKGVNNGPAMQIRELHIRDINKRSTPLMEARKTTGTKDALV